MDLPFEGLGVLAKPQGVKAIVSASNGAHVRSNHSIRRPSWHCELMSAQHRWYQAAEKKNCSPCESLKVLWVLSSWQPVAAELGLSICPHANPRAIALEGPRGLGPGCDAAEEGRLQHSCIHGCNFCLLAVYACSCAQMRSTDKVSICLRAPLRAFSCAPSILQEAV